MPLRDNINSSPSHQLAFQSVYITQMEPPRRSEQNDQRKCASSLPSLACQEEQTLYIPPNSPVNTRAETLPGHFSAHPSTPLSGSPFAANCYFRSHLLAAKPLSSGDKDTADVSPDGDSRFCSRWILFIA